MNAARRICHSALRNSVGPTARLCSGLALVLLVLASAHAVEPAHGSSTTPPKPVAPPVLSIGSITIAPSAVGPDASKAAPAIAPRGARTQTRHIHKLRPGDLMLPTYLLDRA